MSLSSAACAIGVGLARKSLDNALAQAGETDAYLAEAMVAVTIAKAAANAAQTTFINMLGRGLPDEQVEEARATRAATRATEEAAHIFLRHAAEENEDATKVLGEPSWPFRAIFRELDRSLSADTEAALSEARLHGFG